MGRTLKDKEKLGNIFISNLSIQQKCKAVTGGHGEKQCNCISKFGCDLSLVKDFFTSLNHLFWTIKHPPRTNDKKIDLMVVHGENLAGFLEEYLFESKETKV